MGDALHGVFDEEVDVYEILALIVRGSCILDALQVDLYLGYWRIAIAPSVAGAAPNLDFSRAAILDYLA
jgi:hypothetical protein